MAEDHEEQGFSQALLLASAAWVPMVLNAVIRLDVLEIIAKAGPGSQLSASEITAKLSTVKPEEAAVNLDRMLALLAGNSVVTCSVEVVDGVVQRRYGLGPAGKYFVKGEQYGGASLSPLLAYLVDKDVMGTWYGLEAGILEGGTAFEKTHGAPLFKYIANDPRLMNFSNVAMTNYTELNIKKLLECYKGFENVKTLVDVGGARGQVLSMITSKYPNIKGINFDLPHVVGNAPSYPGVEHKGGDMFESVPEGDAILMKWILHLFDDEKCVKILKNCYKALPEDGKLYVLESIVPANPSESDIGEKSTLQIDLLRVAFASGPKERTEAEFKALAKKAGFKGIKLECLVCNLWVIVFQK
ncbi:OLC1v1030158C1 [Oldenlandia corymbosa var. corymbosa]|uniref:OLC1v1030158C1 n=1 Tax=Oldenlandia corymbosa var. corymbosa TaxID=529605 RepID=A0AAV1CIH9_OLDCO|nr:OLC1v1030158C1 [Oldenlandia corymbosa var. corymbosa]